MKKKLRDELMKSTEKVYEELIPIMFPKLTISEEQRTAFLQTWNRSPFKKGMNEFLCKFPDEQFPLFENLLKRFPLEVRKYVKSLQQSANTLGGRDPILADDLRREACDEVRKLQQRGFKLKSAIAEVATQYGLTSTQLTGIWKHRTRYKT